MCGVAHQRPRSSSEHTLRPLLPPLSRCCCPPSPSGAPNTNNTGNKNPGPSEYDPRERIVRSASPSYTFKGVSAKDYRLKNPAPGHYNPHTCVEAESGHSTAPAISMSHRLPPPSSHSRQPAPGEYDPYSPYLQMNKGLPVTIKFRWVLCLLVSVVCMQRVCSIK